MTFSGARRMLAREAGEMAIEGHGTAWTTGRRGSNACAGETAALSHSCIEAYCRVHGARCGEKTTSIEGFQERSFPAGYLTSIWSNTVPETVPVPMLPLLRMSVATPPAEVKAPTSTTAAVWFMAPDQPDFERKVSFL